MVPIINMSVHAPIGGEAVSLYLYAKGFFECSFFSYKTPILLLVFANKRAVRLLDSPKN